jgi:hypothetical protein
MAAVASFDDQGWSELYDERGASGMSGLGMGAVDAAPLLYVPNLADTGHGAAYNPGTILADAHALNFLGFIPDALMSSIVDTTGRGGQADLAAGVGAFSPLFKQAVTDFQQTSGGLTVDGFIGANTRAALGAAVAAKNAQTAPVAPPFPVPGLPPVPGVPPVIPTPGLPPVPVPPGGLQPAAQTTDGGLPIVPIVLGVAVLGVAAYLLLSD